jgi:thiol-disulfide isomerase/thioredoxin
MAKTWLIYISSLIAGLYSQVALAQSSAYKLPDTIVVKMQYRAGSPQLPRIKAGRMLPNYAMYSGIPADLDLFRVFVFDFHIPATAYLNYFKSEEEKQKMARGAPFTPKGSAIATMPVKSGVAVLAGIKGNKKIVICDANNDQNFSNDERLAYKVSETGDNIRLDDVPVISVKYEYQYQGKIIPRQALVRIRPFYSGIKFSDPLQQQLQVFLSLEQYPEGTFIFEDKTYKIGLPSPLFMDGNYSQSAVLFGEAGSEYRNIVPYLFIGDAVTEQEKEIRIADVSELGDRVKLVISKPGTKRKGIRVGETVAALAFTALDGQQISSDYNFKPYILLEFWGTWCGPCIAGIPALKTLFRKNKAHLSLISVAYDRDIDKVRTFVKKNNLDWMHTFAQMNHKGKGTLIEELQVDAYPTYILLDKNLNILARGISEKALTEIEEILNKNN